MVTHDQDEAMEMADRIVVMHRGAIAQVGTAPELYHRPANRFVAEFIGRMNVLRLDAPADGPPGLGGAPLRLPAPARVVGIRPEDVEPADGGADAVNEVVGTVRKAVFLGSVTHVTLAVGDQTLLVELGGAERPPERGARMAVRLPPDRLRPLDDT
jgi:iron(III) transport system ATP-binding protein